PIRAIAPDGYEFSAPNDQGRYDVDVDAGVYDGLTFGLFARPQLSAFEAEGGYLLHGEAGSLSVHATDADGPIARVLFYAETYNLEARQSDPWIRGPFDAFSPKSEDLIGVDLDGTDGWTVSWDRFPLPTKNLRVYAVAQDADGHSAGIALDTRVLLGVTMPA